MGNVRRNTSFHVPGVRKYLIAAKNAVFSSGLIIRKFARLCKISPLKLTEKPEASDELI